MPLYVGNLDALFISVTRSYVLWILNVRVEICTNICFLVGLKPCLCFQNIVNNKAFFVLWCFSNVLNFYIKEIRNTKSVCIITKYNITTLILYHHIISSVQILWQGIFIQRKWKLKQTIFKQCRRRSVNLFVTEKYRFTHSIALCINSFLFET